MPLPTAHNMRLIRALVPFGTRPWLRLLLFFDLLWWYLIDLFFNLIIFIQTLATAYSRQRYRTWPEYMRLGLIACLKTCSLIIMIVVFVLYDELRPARNTLIHWFGGTLLLQCFEKMATSANMRLTRSLMTRFLMFPTGYIIVCASFVSSTRTVLFGFALTAVEIWFETCDSARGLWFY